MHERMQPCKTVDQKIRAKEMDGGGSETIYGLGVTQRCKQA